jgi:hypothetical protein
MLNKRYEWVCSEPGCCVFMGGTADFDIYMADCHKSPHNPHVLLIGDVGMQYEFTDVKNMDEFMPIYRDYHDYDALLAAQTFVHLFFPKGGA